MRLPITILALLLALPAQAADWLYLTSPGDTLIGIGKQYLKNPDDWPKVQVANTVKDPRKLPSNTRIRIPVELLKVTPAPVTVTAITGNVRVKRGDGPFQALTANERLTGGETVLTGPRSSAAFRFADDTTLTQQASSRLVFGRLAAYGKTGMVSTEISLEGGRLEASAARQQAPAGGFRVITPVAVAGLRGTGFRLNLAEDGKTLRSEVLDGAVAVAAQGVEVTVAGGQGTIAELGKPPAPPRALLARPDLGGLPARVTHLPLSFTWPAQAGATAWRAQIAADTGFTLILLDEVFPRAEVVWMAADEPADGEAGRETADSRALADGTYHLRVRAIDADGLEGLHADHAFTLDARPLPPPALGPCLGERLLTHEAEFSWSAAAGAQGYLLRIAPTPAFDNGIIERRLPGVTRHVETLAAGDWHWRIASLDAAGEPRAFGPHRAFRVQPPPEAPETATPRAEPGQVGLAWGGVLGAQHYALEIASDFGFEQPLQRHEAATTNFDARLAPGKYYWRVRGVEADGLAGSWSAPGALLMPPAPPLASAPADGAHARDAETRLQWTQADGALAYRVQIAASPDFTQPVVDRRLADTAFIWRAPTPGVWHWRVAALGVEDASLGYSAPRSWRHIPQPAAPGQPSALEEGGLLRVTWRGEAPAYRLELARDAGFQDIYSRHAVTAPQALLIKPAPGTYWLRVIALDADGAASAPGEPRQVVVKPLAAWWLLPFLFLMP